MYGTVTMTLADEAQRRGHVVPDRRQREVARAVRAKVAPDRVLALGLTEKGAQSRLMSYKPRSGRLREVDPGIWDERGADSPVVNDGIPEPVFGEIRMVTH